MTREEAIKQLKQIIDVASKMERNEKEIEALDMAIKALEQESCEDCISRSSIKHKLQEHHDFFVSAYGGFSNLPQNDKSRVDEITNCIAMVVNEPSVNLKEKTGKWVKSDEGFSPYECSVCSSIEFIESNYCPNCGAYMHMAESEVETDLLSVNDVSLADYVKENYIDNEV